MLAPEATSAHSANDTGLPCAVAKLAQKAMPWRNLPDPSTSEVNRAAGVAVLSPHFTS